MHDETTELLLIEWPAANDIGVAASLADEMLEDPRCHMVVTGMDETGVVLVTIWDAETVDEVVEGLGGSGRVGVRRLSPVGSSG